MPMIILTQFVNDLMISSKPKGLFIELTDRTAFLARTSSLKSPLTVEEFKEVSLDDKDGAAGPSKIVIGLNAGGAGDKTIALGQQAGATAQRFDRPRQRARLPYLCRGQ